MSKPIYCLHKLQEALAEFLNIDVKSLPSIEDNLKAAGYIGIQKNDEIEYFSKGLEEFGTNYPQYYRRGKEAIAKLLETKQGQVAGAFYKEGLGDIDLVWGNENLGLQKIITKHLDDFKVWGEGEEGVIKGLDDIVSNGELVTKNGVNTIYFYKDNREFKIGLSKGWDSKGDNNWIITAYENKPKNKGSIETSDHDTFTPKEPLSNLDKENSTTNSHNVSKAQAKKQEVLNKIKSKEHKEYLRLQTKLEESKQLEAQAFTELEPIKERILAQTKAKEYYAQALEKLDISAFNGYQIKDELKPIFSTIKKARRGQEHYKERLFSYPLKKLQGKSLTFNEKEFPLYENALTLKQSHSIDKNPKLIKERVALRKAIESHLDIKPIKEFGTNYAEGYHDGAFSIQKLLTEAKDYEARKEAGKLTEAEIEQGAYKGQVAGAFHKEELGDIDLVWGEVSGKGKQAQGFGLAKILEKHAKNGEFKEFGGESVEEQMQNALIEIIDKGKVIDENGRVSIVLDYKDKVYRLGLKGNYKWIITAYEDREATKFIPSDDLTKGETLPLNSKDNSTTDSILQANSHIGTGNTKKDFDLSSKEDFSELKSFFHTHSSDTQEAKELFDRVLAQAQNFKIKVDFTSDLPRQVAGEYNKYDLIKVLESLPPERKAQTLFHELIHSVTTNAMSLVNIRKHIDPTTILHPKQIEAVKAISAMYKDIKTKMPKFSATSRNYGMKNEFEFIAELANPEFREKLKKLNVFEKIVDAITKIVVYLKDSVRGYGKPTGNVYEKSKQALLDIIDNYDKDFLDTYRKSFIREESKELHYSLLESKFINDRGEIDFSKIEARELPKADFNNTKEFKSKFTKTQGKYGYIQTPYKEIKVNIPYAYKHFYVNTNNVNRNYIKGAFFDTFANPLFIAKKQTDKGESVYFYNVYKDSDGNNLGIFGIGVDSNGNVDFKTLYKDNGNNRLKEMIGLDDGNIVYTNPSLALPNHNTIAGLSRPSTAMDSAATTSGKETESSDSTTESVLLSKRNESEVSLAKAQAKFNYDEKKAKDLLEWHKDSHPLTKDSDGLPKVFYHGSKAKDLEEFKSEFDQSGLGFWFNADENRAKAFAKSSSDRLYPVFLYIKRPFDLNQSITTKNVKELSELLGEDLHKYIATDKQSLQKELDKATKSKDFAVIEGRGLMLESNKKISEYAYNYNGKWYVNLYNEADLQREGLEKLLPFMQKAQNLNQTKTITELLNKKEMGEYQKNTHRFLQNLKAKGYDSILPNGKAKNDDIVIFDSKQIKHINNKGSYTDSNGNITATKPKGVEAKHKYFNEGSPNIYQSNAHIGSGMLGGSVAGVESDENGNIIGFDPQKFALGFLGGAGGSVALSKGFRWLGSHY